MKVLVVAHGPDVADVDTLARLGASADLVLGADGGAEHLLAAGIRPDIVVGDLDSLGRSATASLRADGVEIRRSPTDKDLSDLDLALDVAAEQGATEIDCTGIAGGRLDHTLSALGSLARHADLRPVVHGAQSTSLILSTSGRATALVHGPAVFSLMALLGEAVVTCSGSRWSLSHATLLAMSSWALSNEVVDGATARADIHGGVVLLHVLAE